MWPSGENRAVSSSGDVTSATPGTAAICVTTDRMADSFDGGVEIGVGPEDHDGRLVAL